MDLSMMNKEQKEAIVTTEGPLIVMAGAGSGKTRVLTHRIAYLLEEKDIPSYNILAITFTNKAAKEMRERVDMLIKEDTSHMWISTFHAMCVRILRRDIDKIGYDRSFSILDTTDQLSVVRDVLKKRNIDVKRYPPRQFLNYISNNKNELITVKEARDLTTTYIDELMANVYHDYQEMLFKNSALDFDDLIMLTIELFEKHKDVLSYYQNKFQYIHVDEYQDTNHAQYKLVKMLAEQFRNICVVGDSDQSIYKFRGADISNILNFEEDYKDAKVVMLEENYRSREIILDAANKVIENNTERKPKILRTSRGRGEKIMMINADNEREEGTEIVSQMQKLNQEGFKYRDMAVLYRANSQSRAIEDALVKSSMPYNMVGGMKFYQRAEIKDLMSYMKVVLNPFDDIAMVRIINTPKRGIGVKTIETLENHAVTLGTSIYDAMKEADFIGIPKGTANKLAVLLSTIDKLKDKAKYMSVTELVDEILHDTGYLEMLIRENTLESTSRIENLEEFKTVTKEFDEANEISDDLLFDFLSDMALVSDQDNIDSEDRVTLMTIHASKGLEFKVVFLVGLEDGLFPSSRSMDTDEEMEEERRLMYVALTRAEDRLILSRAKLRTIYGRTNYTQESTFLKEIPEELLEYNSPFKREMKSGSKRRATRTYTNNEGVSFKVGDKVTHPKFGDGLITQVKGSGDSEELDIIFQAVGPKRLLANFAPIKKKD
ncbi:DNA helicase PcrA [Phocicoccus pinnipedialis]|uniref:ATP-dependent DNA helicase n=1 Tax=Phocicoccus pinnipedialis TaxID=110845 RepID=A0A6V7R9C0_9BACL|nr:DNA helicase PcrA [Jeotgalicoccus pinnipedialis]CAD2074029.1 ATP-dependent DNA helicase PcrA [Jeotgalicoccus pinnipedialis]